MGGSSCYAAAHSAPEELGGEGRARWVVSSGIFTGRPQQSGDKWAAMAWQTTSLGGSAANVQLTVPDVSRQVAYTARYLAASIRTLTKRHGLVIGEHAPRFETQFTISAAHKRSWANIFGVGELEEDPPFTYYSQAGQLLMIEFLRALGINLRHLLHLRTEMKRNVEQSTGSAGTAYKLSAHVASCTALERGRAIVVLQSDLKTMAGEQVSVTRETLIIRNVPALHLERIRAVHGSAGDGQTAAAHSSRSEISFAPDVRLARSMLHVPAGMGPRYGAVSGDLNPVHTSKLAARLFGFRRPFIQGLCTANYALLELTRRYGPRLRQFEVTFAKPVYTGQSVEFLSSDGRFAFLDRAGRQLAFGHYEHDALRVAPAAAEAVLAGARPVLAAP